MIYRARIYRNYFNSSSEINPTMLKSVYIGLIQGAVFVYTISLRHDEPT